MILLRTINNYLFLTTCFTCLLGFTLRAQDILTFKNGDALIVKVFEINDTELKYKNMDNLEGPLYTIFKSDVFSVKYPNGVITVFENEIKKSEVANVNQPLQDAAQRKAREDSADFADITRKRFGGPRIGVTFISPGTTTSWLKKEGKNPIITQFGWQFEQRLFATPDGTSGLVEFVPLIGGLEQGLFVPSLNILFGIRGGGKKNYEFGMGPNFSVIPSWDGKNQTGAVGFVIALGTNFKKGNIYFPINLAFVPSVGSRHDVDLLDLNGVVSGTQTQKFETGFKLSLLIGFNTRVKTDFFEQFF